MSLNRDDVWDHTYLSEMIVCKSTGGRIHTMTAISQTDHNGKSRDRFKIQFDGPGYFVEMEIDANTADELAHILTRQAAHSREMRQWYEAQQQQEPTPCAA